MSPRFQLGFIRSKSPLGEHELWIILAGPVTLSQEAHFVANLASFLFEFADELSADDLALGFGLFYVNQLVKEAVGCVYALSCYLHTRHFPAPQLRL